MPGLSGVPVMSGAPQVFPQAQFADAGQEAGLTGAMQGKARNTYYGEIGSPEYTGGFWQGQGNNMQFVRTGYTGRSFAESHGGTEGEFAKGYFDALAPGTSQWERLGKPAPGGESGAGAVQAANQRKIAEEQRRNQQDMQERELQTRLEVARLNANAQVKVAEIGSGPGHRQATMGEQRLPVEQERMKTETELTRLKQVTEKAGLPRIAAEIENLRANRMLKNSAEAMNEMETWLKSLQADELAAVLGDRKAAKAWQDEETVLSVVDQVMDLIAKGGAIVGGGVAFRAMLKKILQSTVPGRVATGGYGAYKAWKKANP